MFKQLLSYVLVASLTLSGVRPVNAAAAQRESAAPQSVMMRLAETMRAQLGKSLLNDVQSAQAATTAVSSASIPAPALKPLVVARVQSAYTPSGLVSGTLVITYTAINRLPLDELTGAEVRVKLAPGVSLVSGPAHLTLPDGSLSFALGTLGPADGASVAIVVQAPAAVGMIDEGARASASFVNKRVSAQTAPARLVNDAFAPYLGQQPEFMFNDVDLLEVAGLVEQDAVRAFALVRDATHWEAYRGSLRGARGTWWSEAGNALDRSSLLLGVLRTIGVPSRYVRGGLSDARQRELIGQMFLNDMSQTGQVPPEDRYDPYSDAKLLQAAGEHWWVEADLGSGWQALDANFKGAAIGQVFGAGGTPLTTIPDADRHWTKIALTVEHLPALLGAVGRLETFKPLELTLPTAQIAGLPLAVGHFVRTENSGGAVFYNIRHNYTPFVAIGGIRPEATFYRGDEYVEQVTNFPLGSQRVTAASFDVTVYGPDVMMQTYRDEIVDRIGKLIRREGGTVDFSRALSSTEPVVRDRESVSVLIAPNWVPERIRNRMGGRLKQQTEELQQRKQVYDEVVGENPVGELSEQQTEALVKLDLALTMAELLTADMVGMEILQDFDQRMREFAVAGRVAAYAVVPRVIFNKMSRLIAGERAGMRSESNFPQSDLTLVPYPGQSKWAATEMRLLVGVNAVVSENLTQHKLGASMMAGTEVVTRPEVRSLINVLAASAEQGIELMTLFPEQSDRLENLSLSTNAKALILEALRDRGQIVIVPERSPQIGSEPYVAWLEVDPSTGKVQDRDENGKHSAIMDFFTIYYKNFRDLRKAAFYGFMSGFATAAFLRTVVHFMFPTCEREGRVIRVGYGEFAIYKFLSSFDDYSGQMNKLETCKLLLSIGKDLVTSIVLIVIGYIVRLVAESIANPFWKVFLVGLSVDDKFKIDYVKLAGLSPTPLQLTYMKQWPGTILTLGSWLASAFISMMYSSIAALMSPDGEDIVATYKVINGLLSLFVSLFNFLLSWNRAELYVRLLQGGFSWGVTFVGLISAICKLRAGLYNHAGITFDTSLLVQGICPDSKPGYRVGINGDGDFSPGGGGGGSWGGGGGSGSGGSGGGSSGGGGSGGSGGGGSSGGTGPLFIPPSGFSLGMGQSAPSLGGGGNRFVSLQAGSASANLSAGGAQASSVRLGGATGRMIGPRKASAGRGNLKASSGTVRTPSGQFNLTGPTDIDLPDGGVINFGSGATMDLNNVGNLSVMPAEDSLQGVAELGASGTINLNGPATLEILAGQAVNLMGQWLLGPLSIFFEGAVLEAAQNLNIFFEGMQVDRAQEVNLGGYSEPLIGPRGELSIASMANATPGASLTILDFNGQLSLGVADGDTIALSVNGAGSWLGILRPEVTGSSTLSTTLNPSLSASTGQTYTLAVAATDNWGVYPIDDRLSAERQLHSMNAVSGEPVVMSVLTDSRGSLLVADVSISGVTVNRSVDLLIKQPRILASQWGQLPRSYAKGKDYLIEVAYRGAQAEAFDVSVTGLPPQWVTLSQQQVRFNKGDAAFVHLSISPTLESLPASGTQIPFTVTVRSADNSLFASRVATWTVPSRGIPVIVAMPYRKEVGPTDVFTIPLLIANTGLVTDSFELSATLEREGHLVSIPPSVTVGPQKVEVVLARVELNNYPVREYGTIYFSAGYAREFAGFIVHPPQSIPLFRWAYTRGLEICDGQLASAARNLGWQQSLYILTGRLGLPTDSQSLLGPLSCLSELGVFTATQAISSALTLVPTNTQPLVDALDLLSNQVARALDYRATLSIAPALSVARVGQPVALPVVLEHTGRVSGTFTLTVTDTDGVAQTFTPVLEPGQRFTHTVAFTPSAEGTYVITATAGTPDPQVRPHARATVLAYERLTDILAVRGTPDFVETGNSSAALSVDVVNHTPLPQPVTIQLTMTTPSGGVYYATQVTRTLQRGITNIPLGTAPFVNAPAGVYALEARLVEENRVVHGGVNAGTGVRVATSSSPLVVPPGDVQATTWITTERTLYGSGGTFQVGVPISGGVDLTITLDAAQHSGPNPSVGVAVTVPAGIYDAVYITGAVRWQTNGQWYGQVDILDTSNDKYYILGHGVNTALGSDHPFVGGLPTMAAAGGYHAGQFVRLRVTDTAMLRFYLYDTVLTGTSSNTGTIVVRLTQVDHPDNTLRRRIETAIHHTARRYGLDAIQWDRWTRKSTDAYPVPRVNTNCNGCHSQAQAIAGLASFNVKLRPSSVDERMMEWLSQRLRGWQNNDPTRANFGSVQSGFQETVMAAWAWSEQLRMQARLGRSLDISVTQALTRAVEWLMQQSSRYVNGLWMTDDNGYPWQNIDRVCGDRWGFRQRFSPMTNYFIAATLRMAYELTADQDYLSRLTEMAMAMATTVNWRGTCGGEIYPLHTASLILGLQEALPLITDSLKVVTLTNALNRFELDLRQTQQLSTPQTAGDGGWRFENLSNGPSDPQVTAVVLYALARQGVRSTDMNLMRATEFLLEKQDWNYRTLNAYTSPRVGRWYSQYGRQQTMFGTEDNPVAATTWAGIALPLVYEAIGSYSLDVLHDTPPGVDVLDDTFNLAPQRVVTLPVGERRTWFYNQPETMRYQVISYTSVLTGLRPGEVRPLTLGTLVTYTIESGSNQIALPGAYVQAVKLVSVAPAQQTIGVGQTARYTITLRNPLDQPVVYAVVVSGLDAYGADQTFSVNVPANGQVEQVIEVSAPIWMQPRQDAFWVTVNGGQDSDVAALQVVRETALRLLPASQRALPGQTVTYTAVVSDLSGAGSLVDVVGQLGGGSAVTLVNGLSVPANGERIVTWTLTAPSTPGTYGLRARALGGLNVPEADAQLEVVVPALSAALGSATVGAGMPAVLTSTLRQDAPAGVEPTLPGALVSVQVPAGWQVVQAPTHLPAGRLAGHGDLIVVPPAGTAPGTYNVMMTAVMTGYPQVTAQAIGRVTVLGNGLVVNVRPTTQTVNTGDSFEFEVFVINTGTAADQVVVSATGMLASHTTLVWDTGSGVVAANRVSLAPGQSARFVLAGQATNALVGGVHPAAVMARSLSRPDVQAVDYGWLIVNGRPELQLAITPTYQLVETANAGAWLRISNVGSAVAEPVRLEAVSERGAAAYVAARPAPMVLAQWESATPLSLWLPRPGRYVVTATAGVPGMAGFAVATATVEYRMAAALRVAGAETWPGQIATLPYTLTNLGQQTMNNLTVRLSVPQGPWSLNGISAQNGPLTLTLPAGAVTPGEHGRSYQVRPFAPLPYGSESITVTVELLLNGEVWQVEQARVGVRAPDFRASTLSVVGQQEFVHDVLTYTWRLRNTGDADAIGVQAVVTLPEDTRFEFREVLSVSSGTVSWDGSNKRLIWQGDLPMGSEVVITFRAQASFGLPRSTLASPFEVTHTWRPTHTGQAQYDYPYRLYIMIVRRNAQ